MPRAAVATGWPTDSFGGGQSTSTQCGPDYWPGLALAIRRSATLDKAPFRRLKHHHASVSLSHLCLRHTLDFDGPALHRFVHSPRIDCYDAAISGAARLFSLDTDHGTQTPEVETRPGLAPWPSDDCTTPLAWRQRRLWFSLPSSLALPTPTTTTAARRRSQRARRSPRSLLCVPPGQDTVLQNSS